MKKKTQNDRNETEDEDIFDILNSENVMNVESLFRYHYSQVHSELK